MDPTAPNNPNNSDTQGNIPQTVIQPGQFVVAGGDAQESAPNQAPGAQNPPPAPKMSLAGERQPAAASPVTPNSAASGQGAQPDPTPFAPPIPGQAQQDQSPNGQVAPVGEPPKKGGGSKTILVILAFVALAGIIAAVAYFFVLPMVQNKTNETVTDEQIIETSPVPENPDANTTFGDLPESTLTPTETLTPPETDPNAPTGTPVDPLAIPTQ